MSRTVKIFEIDNPDAVDATGSDGRNSNDTTHHSATSGNIDTSANVWLASVGVHNSSAGSLTEGSGWTQDETDVQLHIQHRSSDTARTDERGE